MALKQARFFISFLPRSVVQNAKILKLGHSWT